MKLIVGNKEEELVRGMRDPAAEAERHLVDMFAGLAKAANAGRVIHRLAVYGRRLRHGAAGGVDDSRRWIDSWPRKPLVGKRPCIEGRIADKVRRLSVIFVAAGFHGEVCRTGSLILRRR